MSGGFVPVEGEPYRAWWHESYGGPDELLDGLAFFQHGKYAIWVARADLRLPPAAILEGVGIPFARLGRRHWKPAGPAVRHFGALATRGVFEATAAEAATILEGGTVTPAPDDPRCAGTPRGYAIVRHDGIPVGCALWTAAGLESNVPKGRRIESVDLPPAALA